MADDQVFQRFGKEFRRGTVLFREGEGGPDVARAVRLDARRDLLPQEPA